MAKTHLHGFVAEAYQAADGDPELALAMVVRLIQRGLLVVTPFGVSHGQAARAA